MVHRWWLTNTSHVQLTSCSPKAEDCCVPVMLSVAHGRVFKKQNTTPHHWYSSAAVRTLESMKNTRALLFAPPCLFCRLSCHIQDPVVHVSVASVLGDMSSYVRSSRSNGRILGVGDGKRRRDPESEQHCDVGGSRVSDEEDAPSEVCLPVGVVACKAGTTLFEAPLLPHR